MALPGLSNSLDPAHFVKARLAIAKAAAGVGPARVLFVGDSTTAGFHATNYLSAVPELIRASFGWQSIIMGESQAGFDTRVTLGSGWSLSGVPSSFSGNSFLSASGAAGNLALAFGQPIDTIKVWYIRNGGLGTVTVNVDGGASLGTINTNGAAAALSQTFTCAAGVHTVNITGATGAAAYILGVEAWLSTAPGVMVANVGWSGSTTGNWVDTSFVYNAFAMVGNFAPDLTIISLGINDAIVPVASATLQANLQTLITKAQLSGDVLLQTMIPSGDARAAQEVAYLPYIAAAAAAKNCGLFDLNALFVNYATANAAGRMFDTLHPNDAGYAFWEAGLLAPLRAALITPAGFFAIL